MEWNGGQTMSFVSGIMKDFVASEQIQGRHPWQIERFYYSWNYSWDKACDGSDVNHKSGKKFACTIAQFACIIFQ